jgi:hypothetical protein
MFQMVFTGLLFHRFPHQPDSSVLLAFTSNPSSSDAIAADMAPCSSGLQTTPSPSPSKQQSTWTQKPTHLSRNSVTNAGNIRRCSVPSVVDM